MCNRAGAGLLPPRARARLMRAAGAERSGAAVNPGDARSADVSGVPVFYQQAGRLHVYTFGIFFNLAFARLARPTPV